MRPVQKKARGPRLQMKASSHAKILTHLVLKHQEWESAPPGTPVPFEFSGLSHSSFLKTI